MEFRGQWDPVYGSVAGSAVAELGAGSPSCLMEQEGKEPKSNSGVSS